MNQLTAQRICEVSNVNSDTRYSSVIRVSFLGEKMAFTRLQSAPQQSQNFNHPSSKIPLVLKSNTLQTSRTKDLQESVILVRPMQWLPK